MISLRPCGLVAAMLLLVALQPASLHAQRCQGGSCPAPWARSQPFGLGQGGMLRGDRSLSQDDHAQPAGTGRPTLVPRQAAIAGATLTVPDLAREPHLAATVRVVGKQGQERPMAGGMLPQVHFVGSGVLIQWGTRRLVLTASHVVADTRDTKVQFWGWDKAGQSWSRPWVPAGTIHQDPTWDFAVLEIDVGTKMPWPMELDAGDEPFSPGEPLASCGYGSDGALAVNRGTFRQYVMPKKGTAGDWVEMSGTARQGDSGGPIFSNRKRVAGVLWGKDDKGDGVTGVQVGLIRRTLEKLYPPAPLQPVTPSPRHLVTPAAPPRIAADAADNSPAGAQCCPAGSADPSCLSILRKKKHAPVTTVPATAPPTAAPPVVVQVETPRPPAIAPKEPEPAGPNPLIIAVVIAAGGLGAAIVYYLTQKHST